MLLIQFVSKYKVPITVVNIIAHMVHSPPIHNDCFVNKDFIIIIIIIMLTFKQLSVILIICLWIEPTITL